MSLSRNQEKQRIFWQAHRGGGAAEMPDNTLTAFHYAWELGGIPEADGRTTLDGGIICLHDNTLARTVVAPQGIADRPVRTLGFAEIRRWDAGVGFGCAFKNEQVPALEEVFGAMQERAERQVYLDIKDVDLEQLGALIARFAVGRQVLIASPRQRDCQTLRAIAAGVRTMLWIGGPAEAIKEAFAAVRASGFAGLDQVQVHLNERSEPGPWRYELEPAFLREALQHTQSAGVDLEVLLQPLDALSLNKLQDMGIHWYATDEPKAFASVVQQWTRH